MNVSGPGLNPFQHTQFKVKDRLKDMPDDDLIQKGRESANASKGAEAAAFVREIKDSVKKEALIQEIFEIFGKLDQSSAQAYDAMSGFVEGITMIKH